MHVVIFEGSQWPTFAPLSLSRPVFTLVTGMSTLLEKQVRHLKPTRLTLWVRPELAHHCIQRIVPKLEVPCAVNEPLDDEVATLVSGRTMHFRGYPETPNPSVIVDEPNLIRKAVVKSPGLSPTDLLNRSQRWLDLQELPHIEPQARMVNTPWDLIHWNDESLVNDAHHFSSDEQREIPDGTHVVNRDEVFVHPKAQLNPGVVLDGSTGPVHVAEGASIGANSVLCGPCCVGPYSKVLPLSHIRGGVTIGACCTVRGEVSASIILGHTNKLHDGYLGHSYLGKWITLGPGTVVNDVKLTQGEVSVQLGTRRIATGRRRLGLVMGDHARTAANTCFLPGSYAGFCSVVRVAGHAPRFVPSYGFLTETGLEPYDMVRALEVTREIYASRDREFIESDEVVMRYVADHAPRVEYA